MIKPFRILLVGIWAFSMFLAIPVTFGASLSSSSTVGELVSPYVSRYDLSQIQRFLEHLKAQDRFPLISWPIDEEPPMDKSPIPETVETMFRAIQESTFGRLDVFRLRTGKIGGPALCLVEKKEVVIDVDEIRPFVQKGDEGRADIAFILAHEIAHYLHEVQIHFSPSHKSFAGLPSRQIWSAPRPVPPHDPTIEPIAFLQNLFSDLSSLFTTHAEIDAYAMVIMRNLGFKDVEIIEALKATLPAQGPQNLISLSSSLEQVVELPKIDNQVASSLFISLEPLVRIESLKMSAQPSERGSIPDVDSTSSTNRSARK